MIESKTKVGLTLRDYVGDGGELINTRARRGKRAEMRGGDGECRRFDSLRPKTPLMVSLLNYGERGTSGAFTATDGASRSAFPIELLLDH